MISLKQAQREVVRIKALKPRQGGNQQQQKVGQRPKKHKGQVASTNKTKKMSAFWRARKNSGAFFARGGLCLNNAELTQELTQSSRRAHAGANAELTQS